MSEQAEQESALLEQLWEKVPQLAGEIVGSEVSVSKIKTNEDVTDLDGHYVAVLTADGVDEVHIFLVFDIASAIAFSGLLVMMQEKVIREHIARREMDEDDLDAMGECVNQITSKINECFRGVFDKDYHFVFSGGGVRTPEELEGYQRGRIVETRAKTSIGSLHNGSMKFLLPDQIFTGISAQESTKGGVELSDEEAEAIRLATLEGMEDLGDLVVLLPIDRERGVWEKVLADAGLGYKIVRNIHDARRVCADGDAGMVLIDADASPWGGLPALARLLAWKDVDAPILMAASHPTRSHLVSCLASGASTYLVKPIESDRLRGQVQELFQIWRDSPRG